MDGKEEYVDAGWNLGNGLRVYHLASDLNKARTQSDIERGICPECGLKMIAGLYNQFECKCGYACCYEPPKKRTVLCFQGEEHEFTGIDPDHEQDIYDEQDALSKGMA